MLYNFYNWSIKLVFEYNFKNVNQFCYLKLTFILFCNIHLFIIEYIVLSFFQQLILCMRK